MKTSKPACLVLTMGHGWKNGEGMGRRFVSLAIYELANDGTPRNGIGSEFLGAEVEAVFYANENGADFKAQCSPRGFDSASEMRKAAKFLTALDRKVEKIASARGRTDMFRLATICSGLKMPLLIPEGLKAPSNLPDNVWRMYSREVDILEALVAIRPQLFSGL